MAQRVRPIDVRGQVRPSPQVLWDHALMQKRNALDRATQEWVRLPGGKVLLADHPWLVGPVGDVGEVADGWVASEA